eukprot:6172335-Pleurochrysis_carterae.AAC.2
MFENDARIERDHPFGFMCTEVLIYHSTQLMESGRIRMDNCQGGPFLACNRSHQKDAEIGPAAADSSVANTRIMTCVTLK